jgi:hydrophobic/amphiphilic exporter-1 (mainly G- bacteria), HAE1 family
VTLSMASRFLASRHEAPPGRIYAWSERSFDALLGAYERGLDLVLAHRFATLLAFLATLVLSVYLFVIIPKGFFPQQDTGLITGVSEAAQDISFAAMRQYQRALGDVVLKDPAVDHVAMSIGGAGNALNTGRMFIILKPRDQRDVSADQVIARLRVPLSKVQGASLFLQSAQDVRVGGRAARTQFQYTLQGPIWTNSINGRQSCSPSCGRCPSYATSRRTSRRKGRR